jgi:nitrogen fixation NifU-like protein
MSDLRELYQQVIIDHAKKPRNSGKIEDPDRQVEGFNPLCGDRFVVYLKMNGDRVEEVRFEGSGCAISTASASLMTETLRGKTVEEIEKSIDGFIEMVTAPTDAPPPDPAMGKPAIFAGVREFPLRIKCATLAWHSMRAAIRGTEEVVTTE